MASPGDDWISRHVLMPLMVLSTCFVTAMFISDAAYHFGRETAISHAEQNSTSVDRMNVSTNHSYPFHTTIRAYLFGVCGFGLCFINAHFLMMTAWSEEKLKRSFKRSGRSLEAKMRKLLEIEKKDNNSGTRQKEAFLVAFCSGNSAMFSLGSFMYTVGLRFSDWYEKSPSLMFWALDIGLPAGITFYWSSLCYLLYIESKRKFIVEILGTRAEELSVEERMQRLAEKLKDTTGAPLPKGAVNDDSVDLESGVATSQDNKKEVVVKADIDGGDEKGEK